MKRGDGDVTTATFNVRVTASNGYCGNLAAARSGLAADKGNESR